MREIKYRFIEKVGDTVVIHSWKEIIKWDRGEFERVIFQYPDQLNQWTGLLDCLGKEIYEGDILEHSKNENYQVVWNKDGFWWVENKEFGSDFLWRWAKVCKVIGNIYENKNLLE